MMPAHNIISLLKNGKTARLFVCVVFLLLSLKLISFVNSYAVNMVFWDQFEQANNIISPISLKELFYASNSEHRIGAGLIITRFLASLSHWNNRWETFITAGILIVSALLAILLKYRLIKKISYSDALIPLLFLNLYQMDNLVEGFQLMFVLPLFYLMLILFIFTFPNSLKRNTLICLISLISAFTHLHGLFVTVVCIFMFFSENIKKNILNAVFIFICLLEIMLFFVNYRIIPGFTLPFNISLYFNYVLITLGKFVNINNVLLQIFILSLCLYGFILTVLHKSKPGNMFKYIVLSIYIYSGLFIISVTYARIGLVMLSPSRYVTHLIPLFYALYISLSVVKNSCMKFFNLFIMIAFLLISFNHDGQNYFSGYMQKQQKTAWRSCYLNTPDAQYCIKKTGFQIYRSDMSELIDTVLSELRLKQLNLYSDH